MNRMAPKRRLIVNADDFGTSPGVNRGILEAHENGIVTSASLMVRGAAAEEAVRMAADRGRRFSLGLHVDLGEWELAESSWRPLYEVVPLDDDAAVRSEVDRQLEMFRRMTGHDPTHMDSHQHVHRREPARSVLLETARRLGIPLRHFTPGVRYCGDFYGQTEDGRPRPEAVTARQLLRIVDALAPGVTELGCHPGEAGAARGMYVAERAREVEALCDRAVRDRLDELDVELCSFHHVEAGPLEAGEPAS